MGNFQDMMRRAYEDSRDVDWAPEPGTHNAVVVEGDAFEARSGVSYAKVRLELADAESPDRGKHWDSLMGFGSPQQSAITAGQLGVLGLSKDEITGSADIDELAGHMSELVGTEVEVTCKARDTGGGVWTTVNFARTQQRMNGDVPADRTDLEPAPAPADDDPPPF